MATNLTFSTSQTNQTPKSCHSEKCTCNTFGLSYNRQVILNFPIKLEIINTVLKNGMSNVHEELRQFMHGFISKWRKSWEATPI